MKQLLMTLGLSVAVIFGAGGVAADEVGGDGPGEDSEANWDLVDGVAAVVGGKPVLASELALALDMEEAKVAAKQRAGLSEEAVAKERMKMRLTVLKALVENVLLTLAGEEWCPDDSECGEHLNAEVEKRMTAFTESVKADPSLLDRVLKARGYTNIQQYRQSMKDEMVRQFFVGMEMGRGLEISEQEARSEMERRFGGKSVRDAGCDGVMVREMGMEHVQFLVEPTATYADLLERYEEAYKCYLGLSKGEIEPNEVADLCGVDVEVSQSGTGEGNRLNETTSFAPAYREVFDKALASDSREFSEPFVLGKAILMIRLIDVRKRCIDEKSEQDEIVENLMGRMAEQRQIRRLETLLDQLRSQYPVEVRH